MIAQLERPLVEWDWVGSHLDDIWSALRQHLELTGIAVGIGFAIALALALVSVRFRFVYPPVVWATGIAYSIPSIALFTVMVPITGFSYLTAEIGLVSYTLLILIRNIVAGIDAVPSEVREAAVAMGYTRARLLREIELPLAMPAIIAGLRIATVTTIGLVTITALITFGGLGSLILDGLRRFFTTPLMVGAILSVALAAVTDASFVLLGRALLPWARKGAR